MKLYMSTHRKQRMVNGEWFDATEVSNHTLIVIAKDEVEAMEYVNSALAKINSKTKENTRYILDMTPRVITAISIEHNINSTNVTGIWD